MKIVDSGICGVILSAGASTRMQTPKALLKFPTGKTLVEEQIDLLEESSCSPVAVVVQPNFPVEAFASRTSPNWIVNENWAKGQFSSTVVGLKFAVSNNAQGVILLPVDVVGPKPETVLAIANTALTNDHLQAIIPEFEGKEGHPIFLSRTFCEKVLDLAEEHEDLRLDKIILEEKNVMRLPVGDSAVVNNINDRNQWEEYLKHPRTPSPLQEIGR